MKHSITPVSRLYRMALAVLTLSAIVCFSSSTTHAQSFVASHDTIRVSAAAGTTAAAPIVITDLTTHAITINVSLYTTNTSAWHLGTEHLTIGADTTHTGYVSIGFVAPSNTGVYIATVRLFDSVGNTLRYVTIIGTVTGGTTTPVLHAGYSGSFSNTPINTTVCRSVMFYAAIDSGSSITVTGISLASSSSVWSVSTNGFSLPLTLTHGHLDTVMVCFDPTAVGDYRDSLVFHYTDTHGTASVVYVALAGNGTTTTSTPTLHAFLSGSFSAAPLDSTLCHPVLFYAAIDSGSSITVNSISLTTSGSVWSVNTSALTLPLTLHHGQLDTVLVCFDPTAVAEYHDSLVFHYTDAHGTASVVYVPLVGAAVHPSVSCFHISGDTSSAFGPITAGTTQSRTLELSNTSSSTWILNALHSSCDSSFWTIAGLSLPDTLPANSSSHFTVTFHAPSVTTTERYACLFQFYAASGSNSCEQGLGVRGYSKPDTTSVSLAPDTTQSIAFHSSLPGTTYKYVLVKNNSGHRVKVEGISLLHATHFSVLLISPDSSLPFYLSADGSIYLKLTLTDTSSGTYADTLLITTEYGLTAMSIPVTAEVTPPTAGVAAPAAIEQYAIAVNPNPSRGGAITVSLGEMRNATIEIFDVLGRQIWLTNNRSGKLTWNGETLTGAKISAGSYILRATGILPNGAKAIASTRLAIQK